MALSIFGDFGFAAGSDETAARYQDAQRCINYYPEVSPSKTAKAVVALLGTPGLAYLGGPGQNPWIWTADSGIPIDSPGLTTDGLIQYLTQWPMPASVTNLPVRGLWVLAGQTQALAVIGSVCYLVTQNAGGLATVPVGTLLTDSGPVCIRDNGKQGGQAIIVDGPNGYLYQTSGQSQTVSFSGEVAIGSSAVITETLSGLTVGASITDSAKLFPAKTTITSIDFNASTVTMSNAATGTNAADTITSVVPVFLHITDPAFLGATRIATIDGWWIFNQPGTALFYTNAAPYSTAFNASYFAFKDAYSDALVAIIENKEELWLIGEQTTEIWYDAGGALFPFQRLVGTLLQTGCKAAQSVCQLSQGGDDSLIWLGRNIQGEAVIVRTSGFSWQVVSTPAVSHALAKWTDAANAIGYVYQEDGHEFYVLTSPGDDRTWVYDSTLPPELAWHERLSWDPYADQWHRHRSNAFMNFAGMRVVGDYQNGCLYNMTRSAYTDCGWPIRAVRRSPYVWNAQNRERVFMQQLQIDFQLGQGTSVGLGSNPQARLRISRDYGATYGSAVTAPMGAQGNYFGRCIWRRLGFSRGAVLEIEVLDPVNRDIAGATLRAAGP